MTLLVSYPLSLPAPIVEPDIPIAIRKGIRSTRNPSPHYNALSYLNLFILAFHLLLALAHPGWRQAMLDEMSVVQHNGTWDLVSLPFGKFVVGCGWVFAIKIGSDGTIDRLKARLVTKGYTQIFWIRLW